VGWKISGHFGRFEKKVVVEKVQGISKTKKKRIKKTK
jgi:hypothetical protein